MSAVNGVTGAIIFNLEGTIFDDLFGRGVCGIGDFDGDGIGDLAAGAPRHGNGGRCYTYSGAVKANCGLEVVGIPAEGMSIVIRHMSQPGVPVIVLADVSNGPVPIPPFGLFDLGFTPALTPLADSAGVFGPPLGPSVGATGALEVGPLLIPMGSSGLTVHLQSFAASLDAPNGYFQISNALPITFIP